MTRRKTRPAKIVTIDNSERGSWSGERYYRAVCGCLWKSPRRSTDRDVAVRDAWRHHHQTHHMLHEDVRNRREVMRR